MGEIICKSGPWNGGISRDLKINPLQMSSVYCIEKAYSLLWHRDSQVKKYLPNT